MAMPLENLSTCSGCLLQFHSFDVVILSDNFETAVQAFDSSTANKKRETILDIFQQYLT